MLISLPFLAWLNVSKIELELKGSVPQRRQFQTFTIDYFQGNERFCSKTTIQTLRLGVQYSEHNTNSKDRAGTTVIERQNPDSKYIVARSGYRLGFAIAFLSLPFRWWANIGVARTRVME